MSALGSIIDAAVASVIAEHPKIFDAKALERGQPQKLLTREIFKFMTREPRGDGEAAQPEAEAPAPYERVLAADPRGIAYCNLRQVAGELTRPMRLPGGDLYLPLEASGPEVQPFAKLPPREEWVAVTERAQLTAWREFFDATLPNLARRPIPAEGLLLPWPWPPSKTGKVYEPDMEGAPE